LCDIIKVVKYKTKEREMADKEPKILATIPRSATEQMQIAINEYKGKSYLDMRIFYTTDDGAKWLPTKKGVTCSPDNLETLRDAVEAAMKEFETSEESK
jgi:hypothetical protein